MSIINKLPQIHCITTFSKPSYSLEELQEQFHLFTSVIQSEFVAYNEESFEFLEVEYDE